MTKSAELRQIYRRMFPGKRMPKLSNSQIADLLWNHDPMRYEFELDRCRGKAWDNEEITLGKGPQD